MRLTSTDGAVVELHLSGYEDPTLTTPGGPGGTWLLVHGEVRTAAGEAWTFDDPCLTTAEALELLDWLRAAADGRLAPTDDPGSDLATSTLTFTEPALAFSVAAVEGEQTVLRVHLSLDAVAGRPGPAGVRPGVYGYSVPVRIDRSQLSTAAEEWSGDVAAFPAR